MGENTKMPPNQDQRQKSSLGDPNKPQKPGSPGSPGTPGTGPDRSRQGMNVPGKPGQGQESDPDRNRTQQPLPGSKEGGIAKDRGNDVDDLEDEDDATPRPQRPGRNEP